MRVLVLVLVAACGGSAVKPPSEEPKPAPTLADCCRQCADAASRDPAGMDISTKPCARYPAELNGGPGVDRACAALFESQRTSVGDCWGRK